MCIHLLGRIILCLLWRLLPDPLFIVISPLLLFSPCEHVTLHLLMCSCSLYCHTLHVSVWVMHAGIDFFFLIASFISPCVGHVKCHASLPVCQTIFFMQANKKWCGLRAGQYFISWYLSKYWWYSVIIFLLLNKNNQKTRFYVFTNLKKGSLYG